MILDAGLSPFAETSFVSEAERSGRTELTFTDVDTKEGAVIRPGSHRPLATEGKQHKLRPEVSPVAFSTNEHGLRESRNENDSPSSARPTE